MPRRINKPDIAFAAFPSPKAATKAAVINLVECPKGSSLQIAQTPTAIKHNPAKTHLMLTFLISSFEYGVGSDW
jgi:hypothetical protein